MIKSPITTHVLDTESGRPAQHISVTLYEASHNQLIANGMTDDDGRIMQWPEQFSIAPGDYRICFELSDWFLTQQRTGFYPKVSIDFSVTDPTQHYHVPLLLSAHGYSTYRGS
ncbi:hydroxyisourate hydrolase [Echinimonas agarilytica]|uniref:5-hydroxyisourate hydrolase n=1 Tax=Echinimonas agarilytica TaxID=1215918 RepID=A0AA41W7U7_9GAMM|nr:hydroxyisourate hydrolase [Echinimonas agarilytica]MCM2680218.1 hydroxyisourate hydrolase [Echinimonas agarilytica]